MVAITIGSIYSTVECDKKILLGLKTVLKYENDFMARKASQYRLPQYSYLINDNGVFFTGLVDTTVRWLTANNIPYTINDTRLITQSPSIEDIKLRLRTLDYIDPPVQLRDIQMDVLIAGLSSTRGVVSACTGFGKTVTLSSLILAWDLKTLVICDSKDLARQLVDEIAYFTGETPGMIGDGIFRIKQVTVGMVQSLSGKKSKNSKKIKEFLESIEYVVLDECHHIQATTWRSVVRRCKNASIVHGFTATAFASKVKGEKGDNNSKDILLTAYIGPRIANITTRYMIELGYLADPTINMVSNTIDYDGVTLEYSEEYQRYIVRNEERNRLICQITAEAYSKGEQVIIFVTRLEHGETLAEMMANEFGISHSNVAFVSGESDDRDRTTFLQDFKDGELPILIGTVLSEGLNFFCNVGIIAAGGDSDKNTIQRLGRILRKKKDPVLGDVDTSVPAFVNLYDFSDKGHPFFSKHSGNRFRRYRKEEHEVKVIDVEDIS